METRSQRIARLRAASGHATKASLAHAAGLTPQSYGSFENGDTKDSRVTAEVVLKSAKVMGVDPNYLLYGKGLRDPSQAARLDADIVDQATKMLTISEYIRGGDLGKTERLEQFCAFYDKLAAEGGTMSKEQRAQFIQQAQDGAGGVSGQVDLHEGEKWGQRSG